MAASKILIVDDNVRRARLLVELLAREGFDATHASSEAISGTTEPTPLTIGELAIDPRAKSATMNGLSVRLTTAEFMVLETLARSAGRVQSRATLTYQALGRRIEPFDRSIDTHVSNIRRKLCLDTGRGIEIKSFRGHGYVLTVRRGS